MIKVREGIGIVGKWTSQLTLNLVNVQSIIWDPSFVEEQWFYYPINTTAIFTFPIPVITSTPSIPYSTWASLKNYQADGALIDEYDGDGLSTHFTRKTIQGSETHQFELLQSHYDSKRTNQI